MISSEFQIISRPADNPQATYCYQTPHSDIGNKPMITRSVEVVALGQSTKISESSQSQKAAQNHKNQLNREHQEANETEGESGNSNPNNTNNQNRKRFNFYKRKHSHSNNNTNKNNKSNNSYLNNNTYAHKNNNTNGAGANRKNNQHTSGSMNSKNTIGNKENSNGNINHINKPTSRHRQLETTVNKKTNSQPLTLNTFIDDSAHPNHAKAGTSSTFFIETACTPLPKEDQQAAEVKNVLSEMAIRIADAPTKTTTPMPLLTPSKVSYSLDLLHSVGMHINANIQKNASVSYSPPICSVSPIMHSYNRLAQHASYDRVNQMAEFYAIDHEQRHFSAMLTQTPANAASHIGVCFPSPAWLHCPSSPNKSGIHYQPEHNQYYIRNKFQKNCMPNYTHANCGQNHNQTRNNNSQRSQYHNPNQRKYWSWNTYANKSRSNSNQLNLSKHGSISSNNLCSSQSPAAPKSHQQQQTNQQATHSSHENLTAQTSQQPYQTSHRTLTYIHTVHDKDFASATSTSDYSQSPSPKSESPPLPQARDQCNETCTAELFNNLEINGCEVLTASSTPSFDCSTPGHNSLNGYESDTSQASDCKQQGACFAHPHNREQSSLNDCRSCSNENMLNFRFSNDGYYGSQQNLNYWNTSSPYSPKTVYSTKSGSADNGSHYFGDGVMNFKKSNPNNYRSSFRNAKKRQTFNANGGQFRTAAGANNEAVSPADRFLARAHLVEMRAPPDSMFSGSRSDTISKGIWDKFFDAQQSSQTYQKKIMLWRYLFFAIKKHYPRYGLYLVGSTISGFGADTSDVDMCLVCRTVPTSDDSRSEAVMVLNNIKALLSNFGAFEQFNLITAKVPILRFKESIHHLEVDLNFNNCVGILNTHLLHCYMQLDWRLRPLAIVVKLWAQYHDINNAKTSTISSYSLVLMVIHFLQFNCQPAVLPCLHQIFPDKFTSMLRPNEFGYVDMNEELAPYYSANKQTLGELLLQFLEYYSNFSYSRNAISVRMGTVLPIEICRQAKSIRNDPHQWTQLCIEEPFDLTNTARSVYDGEVFERIKSVFKKSWKNLQDTFDINAIFQPFESDADIGNINNQTLVSQRSYDDRHKESSSVISTNTTSSSLQLS